MSIKQITFADLRLNEKVTLKLREGESVIVGTVETLPTAGGGAKIKLVNNANSVVVYEDTNFRIFADRGPTVGEVLRGFRIGATFSFLNKHGVTKKWVKTGSDRVTLIDDARPAYSLSISAGFPAAEEAGSRIRLI